MTQKDGVVKNSKKRRLNRGAALSAAAAAARPTVEAVAASGAEAVSQAASQLASSAVSFASPYFKQGANTDLLYYYSGLLGDLRTFFEKYKINMSLDDDTFYDSISKLIKQYDNDTVNKYKESISHTLKASRSVIEDLINEIRDLLEDSKGGKVDPEKMDELLGILYRDMILAVGSSIDLEPEHKIPDRDGKGFKAVAEAQRDPLLAVQQNINYLVSKIEKKDKALLATRIDKATKTDLEEQRKDLINELSGLIGYPGAEKNTEMAREAVPELRAMLDELEPEPELRAMLDELEPEPEGQTHKRKIKKKHTKRKKKSSKKKKNKKKTKRRKKK